MFISLKHWIFLAIANSTFYETCILLEKCLSFAHFSHLCMYYFCCNFYFHLNLCNYKKCTQMLIRRKYSSNNDDMNFVHTGSSDTCTHTAYWPWYLCTGSSLGTMHTPPSRLRPSLEVRTIARAIDDEWSQRVLLLAYYCIMRLFARNYWNRHAYDLYYAITLASAVSAAAIARAVVPPAYIVRLLQWRE